MEKTVKENSANETIAFTKAKLHNADHYNSIWWNYDIWSIYILLILQED